MQATSAAPEPAKSFQGLALRPWEGLVLGLVAAAIVCGLIQNLHPVFRVDKKYDVPSIGMPPELFAAHRQQQDFVDRKHSALYVGSLGLFLGTLLAAREALARRTWLALIVAPLSGAAGGAVGGMLGSQVLQYVRINVGQAEVLHVVGAQLSVALPLGLAVGLGLGLAARTVCGFLKTTLAGLAAGALAAVIFPVVVSLVLPAANTEALLPDETGARFLWLGLLAVAIGLLIPVASRQRNRQSEPKASPA